MKRLPLLCLLFSFPVVPIFANTPAEPAPLLRLDFGTKSSPVQSGFVAAKAGVGSENGPLVYDFDGYDKKNTADGLITVTIAGNTPGTLCARDRGDMPFATRSKEDDLYRDFIAGPSSMTVGISGLKPGGLYEVTFYAFDKVRAQTMEIENITDRVRGSEADISYGKKTSAADADAGALRATLRARVPASGTITFRVTSVEGYSSAILNAIVLTSVKS